MANPNPEVKTVQERLIWRYYLPAASDDGIFGDKTRKAVIQYQMDRSVDEFYAFNLPLPITGQLGPETKARLVPATVKRDMMDNPGVALVQSILKSFGGELDPGDIDGDFKDQTEKAVKAAQRKFFDYDGKPLEDDGVVGKKTWAALWS
jgi:peptidoglycan hydrolase-like protein with peptidoglycan-binding domain